MRSYENELAVAARLSISDTEERFKSSIRATEETINQALVSQGCPVRIRLERLDVGHSIGIGVEWPLAQQNENSPSESAQ